MVDNDKTAGLLLSDFIEYREAIHLLGTRLRATTPEELAVWVFLGPGWGGIDTYTQESGQPEKLLFGSYEGQRDYLPTLRRCWFLRSDVEQFEPQERFITGATLIERWRQYDNDPEDLLRLEISRDRLVALHPTFGGYVLGSIRGNDNSPPLSEYLIAMSGVDSVEAKLTVMVEIQTGTEAQPVDQSAPVAEQGRDETIWTWPKMEKFSGRVRKTISNRAGWLGIEFLERPAKKGNTPEKGLKESDLRRIINNK